MDRLPPELVLKISSYLSGRDLVAFSGVDRATFRLLSTESRLWKRLLDEIKFPESRLTVHAKLGPLRTSTLGYLLNGIFLACQKTT